MLDIILSLDAASIIKYGGVALLCLLVFCSVGIFFCFFIPIGGILFATGLIAAKGSSLPPLYILFIILTLSGFAGSLAGYWLGRRTGKYFYAREESRFFRRSYLTSTEAFYNKYGVLAMAGGYLLPIIRTFAPVLAGIIKVRFSRFMILSLTGSIVFISVYVLTGYIIGSMPFIQPWLKYIVTFFVLVVTIPLIVKIVRTMRKPVE